LLLVANSFFLFFFAFFSSAHDGPKLRSANELRSILLVGVEVLDVLSFSGIDKFYIIIYVTYLIKQKKDNLLKKRLIFLVAHFNL
jgi:hypothetical protein